MEVEKDVTHWKRFNINARIVGFIFLIGGLFRCYSTGRNIVNKKASNIGISDDMYIRLSSSILFAVIGLFAMAVKPYYPKKIKDKL